MIDGDEDVETEERERFYVLLALFRNVIVRRDVCRVLHSLPRCFQGQTLSAKDCARAAAQVHVRIPMLVKNGCRGGPTRHFLRFRPRPLAIVHLLRSWQWNVSAH